MIIQRTNPRYGYGQIAGTDAPNAERGTSRRYGVALPAAPASPPPPKKPPASGGALPPDEPPSGPAPKGDIIYGARRIAAYLFEDECVLDLQSAKRARRRVFALWEHYRGREQKAGFFKLKGALCLSKSQWRAFHGLD